MQLRAPGCQEVSLQQKSITWCPRSGSGAAREARAVPLGHKTATETRHKDFSESGGGRTQPSDELRGRFRVRMPLKETKRREMPYLSPGERMYGSTRKQGSNHVYTRVYTKNVCLHACAYFCSEECQGTYQEKCINIPPPHYKKERSDIHLRARILAEVYLEFFLPGRVSVVDALYGAMGE